MSGQKTKRILSFLSLFGVFLSLGSTTMLAQTALVVEGKVVGYEPYTIKPFGGPLAHPLLFRVTKVLEGSEKSEFIIINFWKTSVDRSYASEHFGLDRALTFKLERQTFCDKKIKGLMRPGLTRDDGKVIKASQTFTLVPGIEKVSLPLNKQVPCYLDARNST